MIDLRLEAALDDAMVPECLARRDLYRPASVLIRDRVSPEAAARACTRHPACAHQS